MAVHDQGNIDPAIVAALYVEHEAELKRFLWGVLHDGAAVNDALQSTFVKMIECGHATQEETRKAWLFRVALHEALAVRRRQSVGKRVLSLLAAAHDPSSGAAEETFVRLEAIEGVRLALQQLPAEQRQIVTMRIYEEKTFAEIASELNIPLGTALARMRLALVKLRRALPDPTEP